VEATAATRAALRAEAVDLAFALAERIVGEAARRDPRAVLNALAEALDARGDDGALLVRAHPDEVEACREALRAVAGPTEVLADVSVGRGGVAAEGTRGAVDARSATRLARLRARLGGAS
jgi:flagellar biosynthesis/type III secretory pathway protein FliH